MDSMDFSKIDRPIRATRHCKHYSYGINGAPGPRCAVGCDLAGGGASGKCMPEPNAGCAMREDYTDAEREAWKQYVDRSLAQGIIRASGIVEPLPCYGDRHYDCPCSHGKAHAARGSARVYIRCDCGLGETQYNLGHNGEWPKREEDR